MSKWIPITERLPEEDCSILLSAYDGNIRTGFYHNRMWVMDGVRPPFRDPIAWMPLPEPYRDKDCRRCVEWKECPNGESGHRNGTSLGYSIGECKDYREVKE